MTLFIMIDLQRKDLEDNVAFLAAKAMVEEKVQKENRSRIGLFGPKPQDFCYIIGTSPKLREEGTKKVLALKDKHKKVKVYIVAHGNEKERGKFYTYGKYFASISTVATWSDEILKPFRDREIKIALVVCYAAAIDLQSSEFKETGVVDFSSSLAYNYFKEMVTKLGFKNMSLTATAGVYTANADEGRYGEFDDDYKNLVYAGTHKEGTFQHYIIDSNFKTTLASAGVKSTDSTSLLNFLKRGIVNSDNFEKKGVKNKHPKIPWSNQQVEDTVKETAKYYFEFKKENPTSVISEEVVTTAVKRKKTNKFVYKYENRKINIYIKYDQFGKEVNTLIRSY